MLSQLYYAAPSPELLSALRVAVTEAPADGGFLQEPWQQLVAASRALSDAAIAQEFDRLFGGVGKPEVFLYGSHYLSGFLNEKPLARLRTDLQQLGLARDETMPETEDHVAYLLEVMRYLIAGDDVAVCNLTSQREFFNASAALGSSALRCLGRTAASTVLCGCGALHAGLCVGGDPGLRHVGLIPSDARKPSICRYKR